jgi:hypothetical protein
MSLTDRTDIAVGEINNISELNTNFKKEVVNTQSLLVDYPINMVTKFDSETFDANFRVLEINDNVGSQKNPLYIKINGKLNKVLFDIKINSITIIKTTDQVAFEINNEYYIFNKTDIIVPTNVEKDPSKVTGQVAAPVVATTFSINAAGLITGSEIEYDNASKSFYLNVTDGTKNFYGNIENGKYLIQKINNKFIPENIKNNSKPLDTLKTEIISTNKSTIDFELLPLSSASAPLASASLASAPIPTDMKKVLVLCQRKSGATDRNEDIQTTVVPKIEELSKSELKTKSVDIKYLSHNITKLVGDVDYNFELGDNNESRLFINQNKGQFDLIILNTCPFHEMKYNLIYELLKKNGLMIMQILPNKITLDKSTLERLKVSNLATYFDQDPTFNYKYSKKQKIDNPAPKSVPASENVITFNDSHINTAVQNKKLELFTGNKNFVNFNLSTLNANDNCYISIDRTNYYKILGITDITESPSGNFVISTKDQDHFTINKKQLRMIDYTSIFEDEIFTPFESKGINEFEYPSAYSSKGKKTEKTEYFNQDSYNSNDENLYIIDESGKNISARYETNNNNPNNYELVYTDENGDNIRQQFPVGQPNKNVIVRKKKQEPLIVFTPYDFRNYHSFKNMYSMFLLINSNILIEISDIEPFMGDIHNKFVSISYNPVEFIETDKFLGYLSDYEFDTIFDANANQSKTGYYHKDYNKVQTTAQENFGALQMPSNVQKIKKTVKRQQIFLVNKKYLQDKTTGYIVIDYTKKYKINPFINKNITNFDKNIYDLYKAYPGSCKVFFYDDSGIFVEYLDVIRVDQIELVLETDTTRINSVIIKNLIAKLPGALHEYSVALIKFESFQREIIIAFPIFMKSVDKVTSIYKKLVEFEGDFDETNKYLQQSSLFYTSVYNDLKPTNWDNYVKNIREYFEKTYTDDERTKYIIDEMGKMKTTVGMVIKGGYSVYALISFSKIIIEMTKFINDKYMRFLTMSIEFREQIIELKKESVFFNSKSIKDQNNQQVFQDIANKKYKESKQNQRYVDELFDKLNKAQDELNNIGIICIILEVTIPIKEQNGNIIEENNMIRIRLLENLGNIRETQGLIAEKHNLTLDSALKYYQMAHKEYEICGTEWDNTYAKNKKLLIHLLNSYNDYARNKCNVSRVLKKQGYKKESDGEIVGARKLYEFVFKKLTEFKTTFVSGDVTQIYYDYAMFLISEHNLTLAYEYLKKVDDIINAKTKGNMVKNFVDNLISDTWFDGFIDKEMGPYNLLAMNVKRELDYVAKTVLPDEHFYLFDNKQTSYKIDYINMGMNKSDTVSSNVLFLEYSEQSDYAETDKTIPIPVSKIYATIAKNIDDKLYSTYAKRQLECVMFYIDRTKPEDIFITTAVDDMLNVITKSVLTSALLKPTIRGGGKSFDIAYVDDYGSINRKNIDKKLLFIIETPQANKKDIVIQNKLKPMVQATSIIRKTKTKTNNETAMGLSSKNKIVNETIDKKAPEIVPNELKIIMNTSIPGFQKLMYSPKMTIRGTNDTSVRFDPLVKLDISLINSVPKDLRIKQFFNKGLFESLINYHGMEKMKTLLEAMREGIINNNISVMLKLLFYTNAPLYINGEVYYVANVMWTPGDWNIDTKQKPVTFDMNKIKNPYVYSNLVNEDIISGQEQINKIPKVLLTGPNYKGQTPQKYSVARGLPGSLGLGSIGLGSLGTGLGLGLTPQTQSQQFTPVRNVNPVENVNPVNPVENVKQVRNVKQVENVNLLEKQELDERKNQFAQQQKLLLTQQQQMIEQQQSALKLAQQGQSQVPVIQGQSQVPVIQGPPVRQKISRQSKEISENVEKLLEESKSAGNVSSITSAPYISAEITSDGQRTKFFRDVYGKTNPPSFVSNISDFFTEMNSIDEPEVKTAFSDIKKIQTNITDINITGEGFSESAYLQTVGGTYTSNRKYNSTGIQVSNPGNFFDAVVKAMNQYNYSRQQVSSVLGYTSDYMVSKGYGGSGNRAFTQQFLKEEVIVFFSVHKDFLNVLLIFAQDRVTIANEELSKNVSSVEILFKEYYIFGLIKPKSSAEQFTIVNADTIREYILSDDYLPGDETIIALNIQLKLGIVVFSKNLSKNLSNNIYIDNNIFYNDTQINGLNLGSWNKFLFLFKETTGDLKDKYGIMTFTYALRRYGKNSSTYKFTIFRKNDLQIAPPLYMLYTIFYLKCLENDKTINLVFYPNIMNSFYQTFLSLFNKAKNENSWRYIDNVYTWFPSNALRDLVRAQGNNYIGNITGGARDYRNNYRNRNNYANSYLRRETAPDLSKICYTISIDLVLKKGSPLTPDELSELKCTQKWENIKREFAIFTNREYKITPVYDFSNNKTLKNKSRQNENEQNRVKKGGTRKHYEIKKIYVGKHSKTRRNI